MPLPCIDAYAPRILVQRLYPIAEGVPMSWTQLTNMLMTMLVRTKNGGFAAESTVRALLPEAFDIYFGQNQFVVPAYELSSFIRGPTRDARQTGAQVASAIRDLVVVIDIYWLRYWLR